MSGDLVASARDDRLGERAPLAARLRPRTLDEVVGQEHLLGAGRPLRVLIEGDRLSSVILWGPPGTGKPTIARLAAPARPRGQGQGVGAAVGGEGGGQGRTRGRRPGPCTAGGARTGHHPLPR